MIEIQSKASVTSDNIIASFHNNRYLMAPHIHSPAELVYVIEGELTVISSEKREIAKSGDIAIIPPYHPHGYFTPEGKTVKFWMLLFDSNIVNEIMRDGHFAHEYSDLVFTPSDELRVFLKNKMIDTNEKNKKLDFDELRSLKATLYPIFDEYMNIVPIIKKGEKIRSNSVAETFRYLSNNFKRNVSLMEVSAAIGYSASYISHSLSETVGMNFRAVLNSMRIGYAKSLLFTTNTSIFVISVECGFGSERSFHRAFQSITGMTPREYRELCINKSK